MKEIKNPRKATEMMNELLLKSKKENIESGFTEEIIQTEKKAAIKKKRHESNKKLEATKHLMPREMWETYKIQPGSEKELSSQIKVMRDWCLAAGICYLCYKKKYDELN